MNRRPLPCQGSALPLSYAPKRKVFKNPNRISLFNSALFAISADSALICAGKLERHNSTAFKNYARAQVQSPQMLDRSAIRLQHTFLFCSASLFVLAGPNLSPCSISLPSEYIYIRPNNDDPTCKNYASSKKCLDLPLCSTTILTILISNAAVLF